MSDFAILKTYEFAHLAHLDRARLADEGIDSFVQDENIVSINPALANAVGWVKLIVREEQMEKAKVILGLNEFSQLRNAIYEEIERQPTCPRCGSIDLGHKRSLLSGIIYLILFFVPVARTTGEYLCRTCGYQWERGL
jgi:hypothetical protein